MGSSSSPSDHEKWRKRFHPRAHCAPSWPKGPLPGSSLPNYAGRVQNPRRLTSGFCSKDGTQNIDFEESTSKEAAEHKKRLAAMALACDSATSIPAGGSIDNGQPDPAQEDQQSAEHAQHAVSQAHHAVSQAQHAVSQAQHALSEAQRSLSQAHHALLQTQQVKQTFGARKLTESEQ